MNKFKKGDIIRVKSDTGWRYSVTLLGTIWTVEKTKEKYDEYGKNIFVKGNKYSPKNHRHTKNLEILEKDCDFFNSYMVKKKLGIK